jgi:hydroxymethylpyrimidine pyrophosphatase-like HAD family hydrolase
LIYSKTIPEAESLDIIKKLRTLKGTTYVSFVAEGATDSVGAVWEDGKPSTGKTIIARYTETWFIPMVDVEPLIKWNNGAVRFSVDFLDEGEFRRGLALFQGNPALSISSGSPRSFELMPAGVSKGAAISFIAEKSGIPLENMMTIGDNYNDIEMVTRAGWGVAMGNAVPALKEKAKWVTADVEENGLALAIENMLAERLG